MKTIHLTSDEANALAFALNHQINNLEEVANNHPTMESEILTEIAALYNIQDKLFCKSE